MKNLLAGVVLGVAALSVSAAPDPTYCFVPVVEWPLACADYWSTGKCKQYARRTMRVGLLGAMDECVTDLDRFLAYDKLVRPKPEDQGKGYCHKALKSSNDWCR